MFSVGQRLGRFRLDREIGQGSNGVVFLATDTALDSTVAIKILHPSLMSDAAVRDRFKRELLLARRISHPGVCKLFDLHAERDAVFLTMEYVEGETLLSILKREGALPPARAARLLRGTLSALDAAHRAGVIHRDLKPANVLIRPGDQPTILDFGTATANDVARLTRPGTAVGSMRFIAPEIFTGAAPTSTTDIYALGVVAYVVLAGKLPYPAVTGAIEMMEMIQTQMPPALVGFTKVPQAFSDVVERAMHKDPAARYPTADAFAAALLPFIGEPVAPVDDDAITAEQARPPAAIAPSSPGSSAGASGAPAHAPRIATPAPAAAAPAVGRRETSAPAGASPPSSAVGTPAPSAAGAFGAAGAGGFPPESGNFARWAPAAEVRESLAHAAALEEASNPETGPQTRPNTAQATLDDEPVTTVARPPTAAMQARAAAVAATWQQPVTAAVKVMPASVTSEAVPPTVPLFQNPLTDAHGDATGSETGGATLHTTVGTAVQLPAVAAHGPLEDKTSGSQELDLPQDDGDAEVLAFAARHRTRTRVAAAVAVGALILIGAGIAWVTAQHPAAASVADAGVGGNVAAADAARAPAAAPIAEAAAALDAGAAAAAALPAPQPNPQAASVDAGAAVDDDALLLEMEPAPPTDAAHPKPRLAREVDDAQKGLRLALRQRGFILGDLPAVERALRTGVLQGRDGKTAAALGTLKAAQATVESTVIDRAFVLAKLQRFNARYSKQSQRPDVAARVDPLARDIAKAIGTGDAALANSRLNSAFALIGVSSVP